MKLKTFPLIVCLQLILAFSLSVFAQDLTVKQIMADPSIAGLRADNERLSPDGTKVLFMWNDGGKDPKNLYLSTLLEIPRTAPRMRAASEPRMRPAPTAFEAAAQRRFLFQSRN